MSSEQTLIVRFRVPREVWEIAQQRAHELGLRDTPGLAGGVSELARQALYSALSLEKPRPAHQQQSNELKGKKNLFHPSRKFTVELSRGSSYDIIPDIPNEKFRRVRVYHHNLGVEHEYQLSDVFMMVNDVGQDTQSLQKFLMSRRSEIIELAELHPHPAVFLYQSDSQHARLSEKLSEDFVKELEHLTKLNSR